MAIPPPFAGYPRHDIDSTNRLYREAGMEPPWTRVYRDGEDVTDTVPPEQWPWPWNPNGRPGQS